MSDETTTTEEVKLEVADIIFAAKLVQVAATRGAVHADELESVGVHYNKLVAYLTSVGAVQVVTPETAPAESTGE